MKHVMGWYWPDHEVHLIDWLKKALPITLNGRLAYQGTKQLAALEHCKSFNTAIDIGAHIGLWSYNLAHRFEQVIAFEPVAEHRKCFQANVTAPNVTLVDCALGDHEGSAVMEVTKGSSGDSKIGGTVTGTTVDLKRLDDITLPPPVDFIKIDCEGYEEHVLVGAEQTILRHKPTIIVEQKRDMAARFGLKPQGAVEWLKARGYKVAKELSGDYVMIPV